ncbi:MAG TPA: 6-phosphogluconolactonase [Verrucomicrobiae bacterium]|nr:6-phosphogluconolactonase [Verrucomicrobiae bacterium]
MPQLKTFKDDAALAHAAAADWFELLRNNTGPHLAALSGGGIAKPFFAAVAEMARASGVSMQNVHFFWADERCVPPDDSESNFRVADENLFRPLRIAADKIHRIKGELPPQAAVAEANAELRRIASRDAAGIPVFDLAFLGIGPDGHIASLMPNAKSEVLQSREPYVHVDNSPKPPPNRITVTYPVLAAARQVWTLITGQGKTDALRESLRPDGKTPFARVLQSREETRIYSDVQ